VFNLLTVRIFEGVGTYFYSMLMLYRMRTRFEISSQKRELISK